MRFLNYSYKESAEKVNEYFTKYFDYLRSVSDKMPKSAYDFAISDWHYNFEDPRCLHDAWIESVVMKENAYEGKGRSVSIELRLLGAFHNGHILLKYFDIQGYQLQWNANELDGKEESNRLWHGDWLVDEISISDQGFVVHEIAFQFQGLWRIECRDIVYSWLPFKGN